MITKEEIKFLKEFNFYIKKYDERLYSLIYAEEIKFERQKDLMQSEALTMQRDIEKCLNQVIEMNNVWFEKLFCFEYDSK